jgi:hypothetical protein
VPLRPPPPAADLDPLITLMPEGTALFRVHRVHRAPGAFNPGLGRRGRFHPFHASGSSSGPVPTLYASMTIAGAFSESVFHDVPYRGPAKRILVSRLDGLALSILVVTSPLPLAQLAGPGLRRLGVRRRELIEGGPATYDRTVAWAAALHACPPKPAGLMWMSRQDDTSEACVLFGDRVGADAITARLGLLTLSTSDGLALVEEAAAAAGIAIVR